MLKLFNKTVATNEYLDYQFIQRSIIPTLHFQAALPRLPIPELHLTCDRYLAAQRPLLIDESYRKTESNVNQFKNGIGKDLQRMLQSSNNSNSRTSYISEIWFDRYLESRSALPLNSNPMLVLNDDDKSEYNDQLIRTTNLIVSSLRFYRSLKTNLLEPEVYHLNPRKSDNETFRLLCSKLPSKLAYIVAYLNKAYPLDMSQYPNLFHTTRIAETDKDIIFKVSEAKHITVQHNGLFYFFNVLSDNGDILPATEILAKLTFIVKQQKSAEFPIGVLTSLERNKWATIRHSLCENNNQRHMKMIDSSLFNVCLDNDNVGEDPRALTRTFLHADGTNRWFDKSFSLIISKDGVAGINFEHSWGDGVAVLRYAQDIYKDSTTNPQVHPNTSVNEQDCSDSVHLMDLHLNDNLKNNIIETRKKYNKTCNSLDINYLIFEGIGKSICKENSISPDAVMQIAFQVGYNKMTGTFASTYESCSTAAFKHGRTETIRPLTTPVKNFTLLNNSGKGSPVELKKMIQECSLVHLRLIKEAAMGQGFDRHLFALKTIANKNNMQCNLFDDPEYYHINYDVLSTSTLNSPVIKAGGFGPTVPDGLGIGYTIKDNDLGILVTSYQGKQNGRDFVEAVKKAFEDILNILRLK